ncbi:helix-turn-helix domain-containing protein [Halomarina pelagica]|uniref:helix-turn-helix domain-containing protein n=1 Tax=Halomarina pelagica TaxID=2961599 RepID=UPI0020C3E5EA|nr:helix-turn-helix domain-containing protein [Halomarina sp. BND7]
MSDDEFDADLSPRDIILLKLRIKHPTAPVRELRDILEEEYGISLSHNRVNELLRELEGEEVFRTETVPNRQLFQYHLFRIAFHYPNFEAKWEDCYWDLVEDPHVVLFANADDYYYWTLVTQFNDDREAERWVHYFFKKHGELIAQFDNTKLPTVHKFYTDGNILDERLWESDEGRRYLEHAQDDDEAVESMSTMPPHENDLDN